MNEQAMQEAIKADLVTLKTLDVGIMPSKEYYRLNYSLYKRVFLRMHLTVIAAFICAYCFYWIRLFKFNLFETLFCVAFDSIAALLITGFIFLMMQSSLNDYVIFHHQLRPRLKTGELLEEKIKYAGKLAYRIFAVVVFLPTPFFDPQYVWISEFAAFFITVIGTSIVIEMEMKRLGIYAFFTVLKAYFDKDKSAPAIS